MRSRIVASVSINTEKRGVRKPLVLCNVFSLIIYYYTRKIPYSWNQNLGAIKDIQTRRLRGKVLHGSILADRLARQIVEYP